MTKSRGIRKKHNIGDIITRPDGTQWKVGVDRKWIYIKKPKEHFKKYQPKKKWVNNFPPVNLPDHIKPTKYPHYYVSKWGIAYREPRRCDKDGRFGEVNEWGLIELTTTLRGNPYDKTKMYDSINIYFYDENNKNIGYKKVSNHQLVAEVWIPNPHGYIEVLHGKKGNRCNHYTNLRWGTHKENMKESSHALPDGTKRFINKTKKGNGSTYEKKDGEWVLIPSTAPVWNKGLKGSSWNTGLTYSLPDQQLPEGTIRTRSNGNTFIKTDGKWVYQKKERSERAPYKRSVPASPDGTIHYNAKGNNFIKIDGKWVYQKKERVEEVLETGPDVKYKKNGDKYKRINGKWVYQRKIKQT